MRAKEYLEYLKDEIYYYDLVKKSIHELAPLRFDRPATEAYFNRYLFADARHRVCDDFEPREGEVDHNIALAVRIEIRNVIADDSSFVYAYNIIAEGRNCFYTSPVMKLCDLKEEDIHTIHKIREQYKMNKEDYPKSLLSDYLLDTHNKAFYNRENRRRYHEKEWWLDAFNRAYELFDQMRLQLESPYEARLLVMNLDLEDDVLQRAVVGIVCCLLEHFDFQLTDDRKLKMNMLSDLVNDYYHNTLGLTDLEQEAEALKSALAAHEGTIASHEETIASLEETIASHEKTIISYEKNIADLKETIDRLEERLLQNEVLSANGGMTVAQTSLTFYYLFDQLGLNFSNSDRTQWARFISGLTGKSYQSLREAFSHLDFDSQNARKNLRKVAALFTELFPQIAEKILRDMEPLL